MSKKRKAKEISKSSSSSFSGAIGSLYLWGEKESFKITKEVSTIVFQDMKLEAKVEEGGLRLFKIEVVSNKNTQRHEAVLNRENELKHRRADLEITKQEMKEEGWRNQKIDDEWKIICNNHKESR